VFYVLQLVVYAFARPAHLDQQSLLLCNTQTKLCQ